MINKDSFNKKLTNTLCAFMIYSADPKWPIKYAMYLLKSNFMARWG